MMTSTMKLGSMAGLARRLLRPAPSRQLNAWAGAFDENSGAPLAARMELASKLEGVWQVKMEEQDSSGLAAAAGSSSSAIIFKLQVEGTPVAVLRAALLPPPTGTDTPATGLLIGAQVSQRASEHRTAPHRIAPHRPATARPPRPPRPTSAHYPHGPGARYTQYTHHPHHTHQLTILPLDHHPGAPSTAAQSRRRTADRRIPEVPKQAWCRPGDGGRASAGLLPVDRVGGTRLR